MSDKPTVLADRFRLVRRLARGGMGELWIAEHLGLGAEVVVKLIAPEHVGVPGAAARFAAEAAAAARVNSPYVVKMIDYGVSEDGRPFLVMEKLEGRDLAAHLAANGRLEPELVARIVGQVASGLAKVHALGIVHRDVKPSNVFLCAADGGVAVKLLDFGVAKTASMGGAATTAGWLGTPAYMSPEQIVGAGKVDARSDAWSLGVLAFECLTGRRPYGGETAGAIALAIHTQPTPKITAFAPSLPTTLDAWFARACAHDAGARFGSSMELSDELSRALSLPRTTQIVEHAPTGESIAPTTLTAECPASIAGFTRPTSPIASSPGRPIAVALAACAIVIATSVGMAQTRVPGVSAESIGFGGQVTAPRASSLLLSILSAGESVEPAPRERTVAIARPRVVALHEDAPVLDPPAGPATDAVAASPVASPGRSIFVMPDERH